MKKSILLFFLLSASAVGIAQEKSNLSKGTKEEQVNPLSNSTETIDSIAVQNRINERAAMKQQLIDRNQAVKKEPNPNVTDYDDQGRTIISKEKFDKLPENRQKWVVNHPEQYIIK